MSRPKRETRPLQEYFDALDALIKEKNSNPRWGVLAERENLSRYEKAAISRAYHFEPPKKFTVKELVDIARANSKYVPSLKK